MKTPKLQSGLRLPKRRQGSAEGGQKFELSTEQAARQRDLGDWRRPVLWGGLIIALAFGGIGAWAATAPLDSAVLARGEVAVESGRKVVEHPRGGRVVEVLVEEGDLVREGQLLVRLDPEEAQAAFTAARNRMDNALARRARLVAERDGADEITFPESLRERINNPNVAEAIAGEREHFTERRQSLSGRISVQRSRMDQLGERIAGLQSERESVMRQTRLMQDELGGLREIMEKGYYPRIRVLERERELARLEGREGRLRAQIAQARETIAETEAQIEQIQTEYREQVLSQLRETETRIADLRERLTQTRSRLDQRYVLAPFDGVVHDLQAASAGSVVDPGGAILQIIPQNDNLIVQARVRPQDIDLVTEGMMATVRMTALSQRTTPVLQGEVIRVSAERFESQQQGRQEAHYRARITIPGTELQKLGTQELRAGMPAEVMIQTGERTLAQYIWKPIQDAMSRGMTER